MDKNEQPIKKRPAYEGQISVDGLYRAFTQTLTSKVDAEQYQQDVKNSLQQVIQAEVDTRLFNIDAQELKSKLWSDVIRGYKQFRFLEIQNAYFEVKTLIQIFVSRWSKKYIEHDYKSAFEAGFQGILVIMEYLCVTQTEFSHVDHAMKTLLQIDIPVLERVTYEDANNYVPGVQKMQPPQHFMSLDDILNQSSESSVSDSEIPFGQEQLAQANESDANSSSDSIEIFSDHGDFDQYNHRARHFEREEYVHKKKLLLALESFESRLSNEVTHSTIPYSNWIVDYFIHGVKKYLDKTPSLDVWTVDQFTSFARYRIDNYIRFPPITELLIVQEGGQFSCVLMVEQPKGQVQIIHLNSSKTWRFGQETSTALRDLAAKVFPKADHVQQVTIYTQEQEDSSDSAIHALEYLFKAVLDFKTFYKHIWALLTEEQKVALSVPVQQRRELYYRTLQTAKSFETMEAVKLLFGAIAEEIKPMI